MSYISGASIQRVEPLTGEINRIESPVSVRSKEAVDGGRDRTIELRGHDGKPMFDLKNLSEEEKEALLEELNKHNEQFSYTGKVLKFKFDEEAAMMYVEVLDAATQELIVSLPPEFLIDLSVKLKKIVGMYIDEKL